MRESQFHPPHVSLLGIMTFRSRRCIAALTLFALGCPQVVRAPAKLPPAPPAPVVAVAPEGPAVIKPPGAIALLSWDMEALGHAMQLPPDAVREYFTDGRRVGFILERRIAREVLPGGRLSSSEGTPYDVLDAENGRWEVRSISQGGVYFCPSNQVGSSRHFDVRGFYEKLDGIEGYIVSDIESFPHVPVWKITARQVRAWWDAGALGKNTKISREKALELLEK